MLPRASSISSWGSSHFVLRWPPLQTSCMRDVAIWDGQADEDNCQAWQVAPTTREVQLRWRLSGWSPCAPVDTWHHHRCCSHEWPRRAIRRRIWAAHPPQPRPGQKPGQSLPQTAGGLDRHPMRHSLQSGHPRAAISQQWAAQGPQVQPATR